MEKPYENPKDGITHMRKTPHPSSKRRGKKKEDSPRSTCLEGDLLGVVKGGISRE